MATDGLAGDGPVVLAFSGGLDTSFCVPYLAEQTGRDIITVIVDTGGLDDAERATLEKRSKELGAIEHRCIDGRDRFVDETLRYLIAGNVQRGALYPLCVGAERTLQARLVAEAAVEIGASAIAHGCTAAGNDQIRFEVALRTLAPQLPILAPIRDLGLSRQEEADYLSQRGHSASADKAAYSVNRGLWGATIGGQETLDTTETIPESAWLLTQDAFADGAVHPTSQLLSIGFDGGMPVSINGETGSARELIEQIETTAAAYGIGRGIHLGDTILGVKGRVAFEAPAAAVLIAAHRELEKLVLTGRQQRLKETVAATYGDWIHEGLSLEPACRDIEALLTSSQKRVTGRVAVRLRPGQVFVEGVASPYSLRNASRGVYGEAAGEWTASDATGFARLFGLPSQLAARAGLGNGDA